jgi:hypothetical protein
MVIGVGFLSLYRLDPLFTMYSDLLPEVNFLFPKLTILLCCAEALGASLLSYSLQGLTIFYVLLARE